MSHTPGPWQFGHQHVVADRQVVAALYLREMYETTDALTEAGKIAEANGRLIAAAPDLLAALESLLADPALECSYTRRNAATAAVAKAKGEA